MKWIKLHTDNHRGRSIQGLMDGLGHTGLCYYLLLEMCAEKINKPGNRNLSEDDCCIAFNERIVRQTLRISGAKLRYMLGICSAFGLLRYKVAENIIHFEMPILLDLLDSDQKKTRSRRECDAAKTLLEQNRIEQNRIIHAQMHKPAGLSAIEFEALYKKYPRKQGKSRGLKKFKAQIKDENDYHLINQAVERFVEHLKRNSTEAKFIPHFDTFMGEWRDWLDPMNGTSEKLSAHKRTTGVVRE